MIDGVTVQRLTNRLGEEIMNEVEAIADRAEFDHGSRAQKAREYRAVVERTEDDSCTSECNKRVSH